MPLTADWHGTSRNPMWWNGRLYFLTDRDGTMNLWSMDAAGKNLRQHTKHQGFDVQNAALANGRIVYQCAGDIRLYDIASATDRAVAIDLVSDFDQLREHWIRTPSEFMTAAHVSPDGSRVALISRARVCGSGEAGALSRNPEYAARAVSRRTLLIGRPIVDYAFDRERRTRRLQVEEAAGGKIEYVHLRAMGPDDIDEWVEQYSPIFGRDGLIVDVRHNRGGNIDSWILERLMREAWMYWQARVEQPYWNMRQAFRGYVVVLCDEWTRSDGEAFTEGSRRLGLGKVIGTRTWGGQIWLTASNVLADGGISAAAESGVYGPEGQWLIEGHGVDPDIVVDNLPHATFGGKDAQLEAAIRHLQELIREKPVEVPRAPAYPNKSERTTGGRK